MAGRNLEYRKAASLTGLPSVKGLQKVHERHAKGYPSNIGDVGGQDLHEMRIMYNTI